MNMVLHGIDGASLELGNTLELHDQNVAEKDKYDVILSNPPYGGKMASNLQTNFRVRSAATEILFVQHIMRNLAKGGRAAVIVPEGVLFRGGPDEKVRKELLEQFDVHTILSLPAGCFLPYTGVKTNVVFFDRPDSEPQRNELATKTVWYFELTNDGFDLKQTRRPIEGNQLPEFLNTWEEKIKSNESWCVPATQIAEKGYDLSARNPSSVTNVEHLPAMDLVRTIRERTIRVSSLLDEIEEVLEQ